MGIGCRICGFTQPLKFTWNLTVVTRVVSCPTAHVFILNAAIIIPAMSFTYTFWYFISSPITSVHSCNWMCYQYHTVNDI